MRPEKQDLNPRQTQGKYVGIHGFGRWAEAGSLGLAGIRKDVSQRLTVSAPPQGTVVAGSSRKELPRGVLAATINSWLQQRCKAWAYAVRD